MKIININLIGSSEKSSSTSRAYIKKSESIPAKTRFWAITAVSGSCIIFLVSAGIWFGISCISNNDSREIKKLKNQIVQLDKEIADSKSLKKNLEQEKKSLEMKSLILDKISQGSIPWYKILNDFSNKIPKDLAVNSISKGASDNNNFSLNVAGQIYSKDGSRTEAIKALSFFALNVNENKSPDTILSNAQIKSIAYSESEKKYTFNLSVNVKPLISPENELPASEKVNNRI